MHDKYYYQEYITFEVWKVTRCNYGRNVIFPTLLVLLFSQPHKLDKVFYKRTRFKSSSHARECEMDDSWSIDFTTTNNHCFLIFSRFLLHYYVMKCKWMKRRRFPCSTFILSNYVGFVTVFIGIGKRMKWHFFLCYIKRTNSIYPLQHRTLLTYKYFYY
jgi:hypothetical protein